MTEEKKVYSLTDMPSFDNVQSAFDDDAALDQELNKSGGKYFEPGKYDVQITGVEYTGPAKDPNWSKLQISYKGAGEKEIRDTILVPNVSEKYGEKGTLFPFKKLRQFGGALGVQVTAADLKSSIKTLFARPQQLVGSSVSIDIGYQGAHLQFERSSKKYQIVLKDGNVARDDKMEVLCFDDRAAAGIYATDTLKIELEKFSRILSYEKSSSGTGLAQPAGW